jgi:hypothetical protein
MPDGPTWEVQGDGIHETTELIPGGIGIRTMTVVPYTITSGPAAGTGGQVLVPAGQLTPKAVADLINAKVGIWHGVAGLTS